MYEWLQKFLQKNLEISRRKAVQLIKDSRVTVNGERVSELGVKVSNSDLVEVDGVLVKLRTFENIYIILNKPKNVITSLQDPKNRRVVTDIVKPVIKQKIFPVGRLDYLTTGLLILTNDGDFYESIIHPRFSKSKVYKVLIKGKITADDIRSFSNMVLDGKIIKGSKLKILREFKNNSLLEVTIFQGINRQIRRMFENLNKEIISLKRISVGPFYLDRNLREGQWRFFNKREMELVRKLKNELENYRKRT
jgi:23S rRNA pseudouridine2605 synthase